MRRMFKTSILFLVACALFTVVAFASAEPGAASAEPVEAESLRLDVTFVINGTTVRSAEIPCSAEGNTYTISLKDVLDSIGVKVSFDEQTRILTIAPKSTGLMEDVLDRCLSERGNDLEDAATKPSRPPRRSVLSSIPADGLMADVLEHDIRALDAAEAEPPSESVREPADMPAMTPAAARERPIGTFFRSYSIA